MYDEILLPTDGSPGIGSAIEQALVQARQNDARIHVLYVLDDRAHVMLPDDTRKRVLAVLQEEGSQAVDHVQAVADRHDVECVTALKQGVPHEAILTYADDQEIDLVVMGTHGRSGEEKRVLGSVTEEVVRSAGVPVMTVRLTEEETQFVRTDADVDERPPEEQQRYIN